MTSAKLPLLATALLLALLVAQTALYVPYLPEQIASHFDAAGNPNQWVDRSTYRLLSTGLSLLPAVILASIAFLLTRIPTSLINLPHKDYWLAADQPARRAASIAYLQISLFWFIPPTLALLLAINQLALMANLATPVRLSPLCWWVLGTYLIFVAIWVVRLYRRFPRATKASQAEFPAL